MIGKTGTARGTGTLLLAVLMLAAVAGFVTIKLKTDRIARKKVPGSSIIYIPSGKFLKYATFGYRSLAADLVYLWSIQYYSTPTIDDRFNYLDHVFSIISELDPRFTDPYEVGALIAVAEARNPDLAFKILDMGFAKCPDQWLFPFDAGHIALMTLKNYDLAMKYFKACMEIPGSPVFVRRLYANALYKKGDLQTSWETWLEIYNSAPDEPTKKAASNHLYEVKAAIDSGVIAEAVKKYQERFGRLPETLGELIAARLLVKLPKDLDGQDYIYDAKTGTVRTATIPWKR